jgi:hypothetical protein
MAWSSLLIGFEVGRAGGARLGKIAMRNGNADPAQSGFGAAQNRSRLSP